VARHTHRKDPRRSAEVGLVTAHNIRPAFVVLRAFPDNVDTVMRGHSPSQTGVKRPGVPRIDVFLVTAQGVDGRDKRGHDVKFKLIGKCSSTTASEIVPSPLVFSDMSFPEMEVDG
jgi:hypothetical protein